MLMRFDPFDEIDRWLGSPARASRPPLMAMDAYRDGDEVVVHFDLPGVRSDSIDLTVERNELTVQAERSWDDEGKQMIVRERSQGRYTRRLFLGENLDADKLRAHYEDGVLTVRVPVSEKAKPRRVSIGGGGERQSIEAGGGAGERSEERERQGQPA